MKIYFSHGKESGPWGSKITALAGVAKAYGYQVDSIDYRGIESPDERAQKLIHILQKETQPYLLVGSSMGGYVSQLASEVCNPVAVFLMAPALFMPGYKQQQYHPHNNLTIVHGNNDEVIPFQHSQRLKLTPPSQVLHIIEGDHSLNSSLAQVKALFEVFLQKLPN
ncbi:alpha/beta hydrolase [Paraferrimonas sp. SM1919]|uniref:YqiA/YcfP family alpha/beta fold hydrolase n=1 Tax=Paraferrimonas sp. SM1919 TaxID=2662263 RepID=UPI0013D31551|nr:alpha/beta hydrolase [Paraferrimonas sp. SM1919]